MKTHGEVLTSAEDEVYAKFRELALAMWKWRKAKRISKAIIVKERKGNPCSKCDGTGFVWLPSATKNHRCSACDGTGVLKS